MWRYRDRVEIRIGMGVDLSGDLCVQAPGCLGACVHVVVSVGEGSVGAEGQEGGGRKETEKGSDDRSERGFLEREKEEVAGLLSLVQKLVYTDKNHLSTFQHSELTAYPNRSKQTE